MTLLAEYMPRSELAEQLHVSQRTLARYENAADGLPVTIIGGRKLYRLEAVLKWIAGRERRPNPRRRAA